MNRIDEIKYYQETITKFGALPGGGITRLLYTDEWLNAQLKLKEEMEKIGMKAEFDSVGNLFGVIEGSSDKAEVIATGSHVDSVVEGGNLDGQFGIVSGLVAIKKLVEEKGKPKNSLMLISLAEEEGSRFPYVFWGSKNIFAMANPKDVENIEDANGNKFVDEMRRCGFDFRKNDEVKKIDKFIEIHIEQGNFLEKTNKNIGVITAITGQKRYSVKIKGQANHAGTTRMQYRKDAIYAYSKIVKSSIDDAIELGDPLVITFGSISVVPNTVNVVPGMVEFSIDCRHPDGEILDSFTEKIEKNMKKIVEDMDMEIEIDKWMDAAPVPMDDGLIELIEEKAQEIGLEYNVMHSGAGHDSQIFARKVPTGMIFVPSIGGISHNIEERTEIEDLAAGTELLENVLYKLAY